MKLEKALSVDLEKNITPTAADTQFKEGKIKSKFNFQCPDEGCTAQVTCANLDKPKRLRKRHPYYKVIGDHSSDCLIAQDIKNVTCSNRRPNRHRSEDNSIHEIVTINLEGPSTQKIVTNAKNKSAQKSSSSTIPDAPKANNTRQQKWSKKNFSAIVDIFLNKEQTKIDLSDLSNLPNTELINIQDFFIEINGQDIFDLPNDWRAYHGKAWVNNKTFGYSFVFDNNLTSGKIKERPSFYISTKTLEESGFAKFNQKTMKGLANNIPKQIFLLSEKKPYLYKGKYINFSCEELRCMDYRL